jgi:hypothetical protein
MASGSPSPALLMQAGANENTASANQIGRKKSTATTVEEYLDKLPKDRREAIS